MNASVVVDVSDPLRVQPDRGQTTEPGAEPGTEPGTARPVAPSPVSDVPSVPAVAQRAGPPAVDLQPIVEVVSRQLQGRVSEACIQALLVQLLQGQFADARVLAYLPILLARCACDQLRAQVAQATAPLETPPESSSS